VVLIASFVIAAAVLVVVEDGKMRDPAYAAARAKEQEQERDRERRLQEAKRIDDARELERQREEKWASEESKIAAFTMSKEFVEDRLKAPGTAEFPWYDKAKVSHLGGGKYMVLAYVDSQNGFGALLRSKYLCTLRNTGDNRWRLIDLTIE
jgi:hypothetical protein